jgi:hypothetical protein
LLFGNVVDHNGKHFITESKMCKFHYIPYNTYIYRKNTLKITGVAQLLEKGLDYTKRDLSLKDAATAKANGVPRSMAVKRIYYTGWNIREAIGEAGRGLATRIRKGHSPNQLLAVLPCRLGHSLVPSNLCVMPVYVGDNDQPYFIVQILVTGKYSIMNADEILALDGSEPELLFDTYIWD